VGSAFIFGVDGASGALSVLLGGAATLNFETAARTYLLTAVVKDASTSEAFSSLSASESVALYVTDVPEYPVIKAQACKVQEQTLFNNSPPGTVVSCNGVAGGALTASDPDTPLSKWANLTFSITGGSGQALFDIGGASGLLTLSSGVTCCSGTYGLASTLDFEASSNSFSLVVQVTDGYGLSASATVTVQLVDVNEPPLLYAPFSRTITENLVGPQPVGAVLNVYDAAPPGEAGAVSPVRDWPTAIRTSASVTGAPDSAWVARARTARLARDRARLSPLSEMPPPGVSISTLKASSIRAAWRLPGPATARAATSERTTNSGVRLT
jgi:hypothetical protein